MKIKIAGIALFALTIGAIIYYPKLQAKNVTVDPGTTSYLATDQRPVVDVVFVLDTTGSMSGLIQTAKEKIWSIASTMASAQPTPEIRIGLVGYRDRGDAYVTRTVDLNDNLDAVYSALMSFQAGGGGDTPESVNKALFDAVHNMSWSDRGQAYRAIFLVGDAPPHMDYNEMRYPEIIAAATAKGIVVNTIQCGDLHVTVDPWTAIADLGQGHFFQVEQAGSAVAYTTPFDDEIAQLSAQLDATRLYYGSVEERARKQAAMEEVEEVIVTASAAAKARRGIFNAAPAGRDNLLGDNELVDAISSGDVELDELEREDLPAALQPMAPEEQVAHIERLAGERQDLQMRIRALADERNTFISKKVEAAGGLDSSLDRNLYETVKEQAGKAGLEYEDGPVY
jgi:Mg-chelatase subunit ChlD